MLPPAARLTHRDDFTAVVRRGRRAGRRLVVMHVLAEGAPADVAEPSMGSGAPGGARVGFVVSRAVGGSVVRHRVARRLRHLMRPRLDRFPPGTRIVVRALPPSADADSASLGADLDRALRSVLAGRNGSPSRPSRARLSPSSESAVGASATEPSATEPSATERNRS